MRFTSETTSVGSVVVLSGAGVSTDSGIQDFRGPSGVWTLSPGTQKKYTYLAFLADPALRGRYWQSRREHPVWRAEPNAGHLAVARLSSSDLDTTVVTQNTDGLHQRAGTPADRVIELHGTMHETLCVACGHRCPTAAVLARMDDGEPTPPCGECGGILKTASTMFGQTMSPAVFARAEHAVTNCDLVLAVGTSLTVEPAGSLCASAVRAGARLVIVNWDPTPYDGIANEIIRDPLGEALPRIAGQLLDPGPAPVTRAEPDDSPRRSAAEHSLPAEAVDEAVATAILCGAVDEQAAVAVLGHLPALREPDVRLRTARWLRDRYPSVARYWDESLPRPLEEDLVAAVVNPRFLMGMLMETTEEQDRRALTVLARAAATRPALRVCLTDLLSVLPGVSPAAVDVALHSGYPAPLADALTALAANAALPAELLAAVPPGTTVLGEFPVLLAESLVDAYERRVETYPESGLRGLTTTLSELAERLSDVGRTEQALAAARRAVEVAATAGRLVDQRELAARAAESLRRAEGGGGMDQSRDTS